MPKSCIKLNSWIKQAKKAQKQLDKLTNNVADPIINAIANLENEPRPNGSIKLKGREGYRIRIGNYRVIYEIQDKELIIDIIALGHRKDIYKWKWNSVTVTQVDYDKLRDELQLKFEQGITLTFRSVLFLLVGDYQFAIKHVDEFSMKNKQGTYRNEITVLTSSEKEAVKISKQEAVCVFEWV